MRRYLPFVFAACSLGYLIPGYILAQLSRIHYVLAVGVALVSLAACLLFAWVRYTREGRRTFREYRATDWAGAFAVGMFLVALGSAGFAALSTLLYNLGIGSTGGGELKGDEVPAAAYLYYLWHLADAVPLLDVPATLNWELAHPFTDSVHGFLALVYAVLIVVPLIYAVTQMVVSATSDHEPNASSSNRPVS